ncbi:MAG: hypothetical protein ACREC6_03100 [Hyphomicrobiaceae bacterium]
MTDPASGPAAQQPEEEKDRKGGLWFSIKRFWQPIKWYRRLSSINKWGQRLWSWLTTKAGASVAAGVVGVGAVGTVAVVKPDLIPGWRSPPPPALVQVSAVQVATKQWAPSSVVFPIKGKDKAGREATFDVVVLTQDYTWVRGSDSELAHAGRALSEAEMNAQILSPDVRAGLSHSKNAIAVGLASAEGNIEIETARADRRSRTGARWLAAALPPGTQIWLLNLGQHRNVCPTTDTKDTNWQRPFIMIGIREQQTDVNVEEALTDAMSGKTNLPSATCYSKFALTKYQP